MIETRKTQEAGKTPAQITVSMIDQDLKDGISKPEMATKYGIKPWEVDEMFKHPLLKGRRPSRKKKLSFTFVDDMPNIDTPEITGIPNGDTMSDTDDMSEPTQFSSSMDDVINEVDPNQVTLEQAIDDAIETVEEAKDQMQQTQEAIVDMLSPTEFKTNEDLVEELTELAETIEEEKEEELKMDDDTFEL